MDQVPWGRIAAVAGGTGAAAAIIICVIIRLAWGL